MTTSTPIKTVVKAVEPTRWADHNAVTFTGRVLHAEIVPGKYGDFLALDIITRPMKDDEESSVVLHLSSSQLVGFYNSGGIPTGRSVTVTGNLAGIEASYVKDGETVLLKRPRIRMGDHFLQWGAKPAAK